MNLLIDLITPHVDKCGEVPAERPELGPCWLWTLRTDRNGYGYYSHRHGGTRFVHRIMYTHLKGPVPEGLVLDHLCRVPACCNPAHLEPVTQAENVRRGRGVEVARRLAASRTHCKNGHPYEGDNFQVNTRGPKKGRRRCLVCARGLTQKYRAARREGGAS